jgi:hypothetical protein
MSLTLALNPTLQKKHFFVSPDNHLSLDLFQTRNGIIAHSIEENAQNQSNYFSQYLLIDIQSREATRILADIVSACDFDSTPVFQHLHYHVQTDSLVYFCAKNTSLLVLDQSSFTIETSIPFNNVNDTWANAKLSTDGQNVVVLAMGPLFTEAYQDSILVTFDMQTRNVTQQILFNQGLEYEFVVAFASSKKAAYIATNTVRCGTYFTTIYSLTTIGNTYQLTKIASLKTWRTTEVLTKLFCLGNYIVVNNGKDLYFINQQGSTVQNTQVGLKLLTGGAQYSFFQPIVTSQYDGKYIDIIFNFTLPSVERYSVVGDAIIVKKIGLYADFQVAYGNLTSGDLMFTLDSSKTSFSILDLKTLKPVYTALVGFPDLMLTNETYSVIQDNNVLIFDLSNDALIAKVPIKENYYYSKEQSIISYLNETDSLLCYLQHVCLITGLAWSSYTPETSNPCKYSINALSINQFGIPEYVLSFNQSFLIHTQALGFVKFPSPFGSISDPQLLNFNFSADRGFYYYDADQENNQVMSGSYGYYNAARRFITVRRNNITNVSANKGFFSINDSSVLALSNDTLTIISDTSSTTTKYSTLSDWNSADLFKDSTGKDYAILSNNGSNPALWTYEGFSPLPGLRNESIKAKLGGSQSYWIADAPSSSIGLVRFYDVSTRASLEKTLISM